MVILDAALLRRTTKTEEDTMFANAKHISIAGLSLAALALRRRRLHEARGARRGRQPAPWSRAAASW